MNKTRSARGAFVAGVAVIAWGGVLLQLWLSARHAQATGHAALHAMLVVLCYNTVLSNVLVALVATRVALAGAGAWLTSAATLAATAVYIFVVGLIYSLLLRSQWAPVGLSKLADELLHDVTPILYVLWWLLRAPKNGLRWTSPLQWLLYPLAYFLISLIAGAHTGRYLYPFGDVGAHGLATVLRNGALILALYLVLGLAAVAVARLFSRRAGR
jgi:hypothetical protein